jgi:hypothetical protein
MHEYDIRLTATIEYGGQFRANTLVEAVQDAKAEMKQHASELVEDIDVERAVFLDEENPEQAPEA